MNQNVLAREIIGTYQKHGWNLRAVLAKAHGLIDSNELKGEVAESVLFQESPIDALWFSRPSHNNREAWELRLVSENPYALFETFEGDEPEDLREEARMEMEARMRERVLGTGS
jgi:hypothetical protein